MNTNVRSRDSRATAHRFPFDHADNLSLGGTVLKRVKGTKEPVVITQCGRAAAVMMSTDAYEKAEHERQLLRLLARGDKEIAAGRGYDLETVMAEADALLADD